MLKGGVVGLGRMGLTHLSILNAHPDVEWVGASDSTGFVLKNLAERIGFTPFSDYRNMLEEVELDFLVVATPTRSHAEIMEEATRRRIHQFVEKPLTLTAAESEAAATAAENAGIVNQIGYVNRFNAVFREAKRLLELGVLGEIFFLRSEMYGRTVLRKPTGWRSKGKEGGGCLYDFATHGVDLVNFLVGPPDRVEGSVLRSIHSTQVDDAVCSTLRYTGGLSGHLIANWSDESCRKPSNRIELSGEGGKLVAYQHELHLYLKSAHQEAGYGAGWTTRYVTDLARPVPFYLRGNEFTEQLFHFIDCVREGRGSPIASFRDGARTDRVVQEIAIDGGRSL